MTYLRIFYRDWLPSSNIYTSSVICVIIIIKNEEFEKEICLMAKISRLELK